MKTETVNEALIAFLDVVTRPETIKEYVKRVRREYVEDPCEVCNRRQCRIVLHRM